MREHHHEKHNPVNYMAVLFSAMVCAALFSPFDRAIYLATSHKRDIFLRTNFIPNPFHAYKQAVMQRMVYLFFQTLLEQELRDKLALSDVTKSVVVGVIAGGMNGAITNPMIAVKHYTWLDSKRTFISSMHDMSAKDYHPFFNGLHASILRGMIYGATYETLRRPIHHGLKTTCAVNYFNDTTLKFLSTMFAAGTATIPATVFVFVRSLQHATPLDAKPMSISETLRTTWSSVGRNPSAFIRRINLLPSVVGNIVRMTVAQELRDVFPGMYQRFGG